MHIFNDIGEDARRQYIDATSTFQALEDARKAAAEVADSMRWKAQAGREYLIRQSGRNRQTSLGPRSEKTEQIYASFTHRKSAAEARLAGLNDAIKRQQRMNRALFVGRAPRLLVEILAGLARWGIAEHFLIVGTHALYAYEAQAGVRIGDAGALATLDIDLLWDTRKKIQFVAQMNVLSSSMLGLLQTIDASFQLSEDDRFKATNKDGVEVDIIRREAREGDKHPLSLTEGYGEEFYAVQARRAGQLLGAKRFSTVIVSASGSMARMTTVAPLEFARFKTWMSQQDSRDPLKRSRDALQADVVRQLVDEYLPQWQD